MPTKGQEPDDESTPEPTAPPPAKKRKLPTIKKNKTPGPSTPSTASASTSASTRSTAPAVSAKVTAPSEGAKLPLAGTGPGARKPPATVGNADFDLRNASVYAELFKNAGGSTPRSGLNRREKDEEKRKELIKLRDEAKAKRALEAKHTFDLQGQLDKIARFEERLRDERSTALYPNFLASKWRELYEREKKRRKDREWQGNDAWGMAGGTEEGEMVDS